jgi:2-methylcitrate dehydratase PrpD
VSAANVEHAYLANLVDASLRSADAVAADTEDVIWSLHDYAACAIAGRPKVAPGWQLTEAGAWAVAAHADDRDDIHWKSLTHPGGVIWPATLAAAAAAGADGNAVARAAALGYEVVTRLARALGPGHRRYWHSTTSCGSAGAAASAAFLLGSDREQIVDAIGHATSVAGGSSRALFERSGTRLFHRAHVVDAGLAAAAAAVAGVGATRFGLEHEYGVLAALRADGDPAALSEDSQRPAIAEASPRLIAVSGWAHAASEAAAALGPLAADDIERVTVDVAPAGAALAGETTPRNDEDAWWSIPHAVAVVLEAGSTTPLEDGLTRRTSTLALAQRVAVQGSRSDYSTVVTVERRGDGGTVVAERWPLGHAENPATVADRNQKWATLVGTSGDEAFARLAAHLREPAPASRLPEIFESISGTDNL